jgi:hypothetical protein
MKKCPRCGTPYLGDYRHKGYGLTAISTLVDVPLRTLQDWQEKGRIQPTVLDPPVRPRALYTLGAAFKARLYKELAGRPLPKPFPWRVVEHRKVEEWLPVPRDVARMTDKLLLVAVPKELAPESERRPQDVIFVCTEKEAAEQGIPDDKFVLNLTDIAAEVVVAAESFRESLGIDRLLWPPWM